ncbi:hypothetical protein Daura_32340 [Dactylosporangium aurantiacum]|uniref:Uncharacterized protein n=1 Tax=Dactylosporangium aurantiacum TaxID=35754 RepID=A0A9Q9IAG6_9ACTN|nr:hypothetical protein [Dactylosporangium aurantiacum]MDG6107130.1 hypothetical protein [Dactylosporangium aurantiacum]UWZ51426.1 hypothetical protein Daura_32340 [Dactylosporangium aurantiacum]
MTDDTTGTDAGDDRLEAFSEDASPDADFADEHSDTTFADQVPGGQEGAEEPESPDGRAGMD